MLETNQLNILKDARYFYKDKQYGKSISLYQLYRQSNIVLGKIVEPNLKILNHRININFLKNNCQFLLTIPVFDNKLYLKKCVRELLCKIKNDFYFEYKKNSAEHSFLYAYINSDEVDTSDEFKKSLFDFLNDSQLFDSNFYIKQYNLDINTKDALSHFIEVGLSSGKLPARWFDIIENKNDQIKKFINLHSGNSAYRAQPKVSIVVPVYNNRSYIKECIDSILAQTLQEIEIIIVNDGSTDNETNIILNNFAKADSRIRLINKKNTGYGHSCNCGFYSAKGEYIAITESDDYILPEMYSELYSIAEKYKVEVVKCNYRTFDGDEERHFTDIIIDKNKNNYNRILNPQNESELLQSPNIVLNQSSITSKNFIYKYNIFFNESPGASFQDIGVFWKRYFYSTRMYYVDEFYYMLRRDNPDSSSVNKGKVLAHTYEYELIEREIRNNPEIEKKVIKYFHNKKLGSTEWHLTRVNPESKILLYKYIAEQFNKAQQQNEIDIDIIGNSRYELYEKITKEYGKKRRTAIIYIRDLLHGGLERSASILSLALRDLDYDVNFITANDTKESSYKYFGRMYYFTNSSEIYSLIDNADIIFDFKFKNPDKEDYFIEYVITNLPERYVPTIHSSNERVKFYFERALKYLQKNNLSIENIKNILCCGENVLKSFKKFYGEHSNISILYNSFILKSKSNTDLSKYGKYIVFCGRKDATDIKGIDILIQAYNKSFLPDNNIKLILIGNGSLDNSIRKLISYSEKNFMIIDEDFSDDIEAYYSNAICTILPSRVEGFSMTIVESLACGTPVIAANVGGAYEVIEHSVNGYLFEKGRVEDLTYYLNTIQYTYPQLRLFCKDSVKKFSFDAYKKNVRWFLENKF